MPPFGPIKRKKLIRAFRAAGFEGPFSRRKHAFMAKGDVSVTMPNPHEGDISGDLLAKILRQAGISREQWERL